MAEALNGTFKAELIHRCGPWRSRAQTEIAIYEWISWYNHARIHTSISDVPTRGVRTHLLQSGHHPGADRRQVTRPPRSAGWLTHRRPHLVRTGRLRPQPHQDQHSGRITGNRHGRQPNPLTQPPVHRYTRTYFFRSK